MFKCVQYNESSKFKETKSIPVRRVWRYQRGNQNP